MSFWERKIFNCLNQSGPFIGVDLSVFPSGIWHLFYRPI